ncbi:DUF2510 domain-containing protein [Streptomyces sp. S4.7]|uniref:DUF2510 domain-containing protein n=1 Tax=Streptomyces sp. S4.7 TaxID=2705439 RepID=UPI0013DBD57A|nr:DUF2510 domain-containing protein [Streptomyces sp. S4.7]
MTQTTPPGWYPDPGHEGEGPPRERWWDGSAWTDMVRSDSATTWSAASGPGAPVGPGAPGMPPYPAAPPPGDGGRGRRIALAVTAAVVVLAVVGGFLLLQEDGDSSADRAGSTPSTAPSKPGQERPAPGESQPPGGPDAPDGGGPGGGGEDGGPEQEIPTEDGYATDMASGISIPVPDGWSGQSGPVGAGVSTGDHPCPGDPDESCVRGGVNSVPAIALEIKATIPKAAAEADIEKNAEESYGGESYGEISSHEELKSEAVTVAGKKGYLVRWKVVTGKGDDGYVQSLAFPSPAPGAQGMLIIVRSGFDINDKAPELPVMDEITGGIKVAAGGGAGAGEKV